MTMTLRALHHFPVKGLSAQPLDTVDLAPNQGFPLDRMFGFARPGSGFDPDNPAPLPKTKFVVLARDAGLATLSTRYDAKDNSLTITDGGTSQTFALSDAEARDGAAAFLSAHLTLPGDQHPTLYAAAPHRFTDVSVVSKELMNAVSLVNLDSVSAFSKQIGAQVDPHRFRSNIAFSGAAPFAELDWIGRTLAIGEVRLELVKRTKRCAATEVNLTSGTRDLKVPALLHKHYGHMDMGVYAQVVAGGVIKPGDAMRLLEG